MTTYRPDKTSPITQVKKSCSDGILPTKTVLTRKRWQQQILLFPTSQGVLINYSTPTRRKANIQGQENHKATLLFVKLLRKMVSKTDSRNMPEGVFFLDICFDSISDTPVISNAKVVH